MWYNNNRKRARDTDPLIIRKEDKKMMEFVFEDGYVCYVKGFSANELKWEIRKHGKVVSKKKLF